MQKELQGKGFAYKALCLVMAFVLVMGFMPVVSAQSAFAEGTPFTVKAGESTLKVTQDSQGFTFMQTGYEYAPEDPFADEYGYIYPETEVTVPQYTVALPEGVNEVNLDLAGVASLVYNYEPGPEGDFISPWYEDSTVGITTCTASVDADKDGALDCLRVQDPYNADWSGGALRYVVTFAYEYDHGFTATADGQELEVASYEPDAYSYYDYMTGKTMTVGVYHLAVPFETEEVSLTFPQNRLVYSYTAGGSYIAGWYSGDSYMTGGVNATVQVDAAPTGGVADGDPDYIQVQTPYDSNWNSTLLYAITFDRQVAKAPETEKTNGATTLTDLYTLMGNIADSYEGTSEAWKAMDLAAAGRGDSVNKEQLLVQSLEKMKSTKAGSTDFQRCIIALTAVGYDCTNLPDGEAAYNAVEAMSKAVTADDTANVLVFTALAYASGDYEVPEGAVLSQEDLIDAIVSCQKADGGFTYWGSAADADMTAAAITALSCYAEESPRAENAMNIALATLKGLQLADGSFGYGGNPSADSTAWVIVALCAAGYDPSTDFASTEGIAPLTALLRFANDDLTGFLSDGDLDFTTEDGMRALLAVCGMRAQGGSYNLYTDAAKGIAVIKKVSVAIDESVKGISDVQGLQEVLAQVVEAYPQAESISVTAKCKEVSADSADAKLIAEKAGSQKYVMFDVSLEAVVDGVVVDLGSTNQALVSFTYAFDFTNVKNVHLYRVHDGVLDELTETPNADGEYVVIAKDKKSVTVCAKHYSAFALAYDEVSADSGAKTTTDTSSCSAQTGDSLSTFVIIAAVVALLALMALVVLVIARRKQR